MKKIKTKVTSTKKKAVKAKKEEVKFTKVEIIEAPAAPPKKVRKPPRPLTAEERQKIRERMILNRREEARMEPIYEERRKKQAQVLWDMYNRGELYYQKIHYVHENGEIKQYFLYSHKSRFRV